MFLAIFLLYDFNLIVVSLFKHPYFTFLTIFQLYVINLNVVSLYIDSLFRLTILNNILYQFE